MGALRHEIEGDLAGVGMCDCSNRKVSTNHIFDGSRADWERDAEGVRNFVERSSGPEHPRGVG